MTANIRLTNGDLQKVEIKHLTNWKKIKIFTHKSLVPNRFTCSEWITGYAVKSSVTKGYERALTQGAEVLKTHGEREALQRIKQVVTQHGKAN